MRFKPPFKSVAGANEYEKFLNDGKLSRKESMEAFCFTCMAMYEDGRGDCENTDCPMHQYMPYNKKRNKREISDEQRAAISDRMSKIRRKADKVPKFGEYMK